MWAQTDWSAGNKRLIDAEEDIQDEPHDPDCDERTANETHGMGFFGDTLTITDDDEEGGDAELEQGH